MLDTYSAHIIARAEYEARNRLLDAQYSGSYRPEQSAGVASLIGQLLASLGSALSSLDLRKRETIAEPTVARQLENQPGMD